MGGGEVWLVSSASPRRAFCRAYLTHARVPSFVWHEEANVVQMRRHEGQPKGPKSGTINKAHRQGAMDFHLWGGGVGVNRAKRAVSVGFWGSGQFSPVWLGGGASHGALSTHTPQPPEVKAHPPPGAKPNQTPRPRPELEVGGAEGFWDPKVCVQKVAWP